jgi:hypothetical protein
MIASWTHYENFKVLNYLKALYIFTKQYLEGIMSVQLPKIAQTSCFTALLELQPTAAKKEKEEIAQTPLSSVSVTKLTYKEICLGTDALTLLSQIFFYMSLEGSLDLMESTTEQDDFCLYKQKAIKLIEQVKVLGLDVDPEKRSYSSSEVTVFEGKIQKFYGTLIAALEF